MKSFKEFLCEGEPKYNAQAWVSHKETDQHNVPKKVVAQGSTPDEIKQNAHKYFRSHGYEVHDVEHIG